MVRNLDRLQFTPIRQSSAPARAAKPAASFKSVLSEQAPAQPAKSIASAATAPVATPKASVPMQPAAAPAAPSLHTVAALPNGGRMLNPTGNNPLTGGTIAYNHNYYATADAAYQLAAQLGGTVVDLRGQISNNQAEYFIDLPNGTRINAGNLLGVLNNAVFQENSRVMDGKIAELLNNNAVGTTGPGVGLYTVVNGQVTFDPTGHPTVYPVITT